MVAVSFNSISFLLQVRTSLGSGEVTVSRFYLFTTIFENKSNLSFTKHKQIIQLS